MDTQNYTIDEEMPSITNSSGSWASQSLDSDDTTIDDTTIDDTFSSKNDSNKIYLSLEEIHKEYEKNWPNYPCGLCLINCCKYHKKNSHEIGVTFETVINRMEKMQSASDVITNNTGSLLNTDFGKVKHVGYAWLREVMLSLTFTRQYGKKVCVFCCMKKCKSCNSNYCHIQVPIESEMLGVRGNMPSFSPFVYAMASIVRGVYVNAKKQTNKTVSRHQSYDESIKTGPKRFVQKKQYGQTKIVYQCDRPVLNYSEKPSSYNHFEVPHREKNSKPEPSYQSKKSYKPEPSSKPKSKPLVFVSNGKKITITDADD